MRFKFMQKSFTTGDTDAAAWLDSPDGSKKILIAEVAELRHAEDAEKGVYHRGHGGHRGGQWFGSGGDHL